MRKFLLDIYGLVRDSPGGPFYKGRMGSYYFPDEISASIALERIVNRPRVDRVEIRQYNDVTRQYFLIKVEFSKDFFARRNSPEPDHFFRGSGKTSFQSTLDGCLGSGVIHEN